MVPIQLFSVYHSDKLINLEFGWYFHESYVLYGPYESQVEAVKAHEKMINDEYRDKLEMYQWSIGGPLPSFMVEKLYK